MVVPDFKVGTLIAGLVTLAAGAAIVAMAPRVPLHRAAGLFFGLRGALNLLFAFSSPLSDLQGRLLVYPLLALPAAAAWLMLRFRHEFGRRVSRRSLQAWGILLGIAVAGLWLAYALDHALFFDGPLLDFFFSLQFVVYAGIAVAVSREYQRAREGPSRRALLTFALGVAAEPAFLGSYYLVSILDGARSMFTWIGALGLPVAMMAAPWGAASSRDRTFGLTVIGSAIGTGILCYVQSVIWLGPLLFTLPFVNAFWTLWAVGATAYASARYRLFSIDLHVKAFLRYGSTTFILALVFWAVSELIETRFEASNVWQSLGAAAVVGVVLYPLHWLARRLADRVMPGVAQSDAYRRRRREEIYVAAIERAKVDGFIDSSEREALTLLGRGLGLTGQDLKRLESAG